MRFDDLATIPFQREAAGVPDWLMGCFRRRSITFFTVETDSGTTAYWLQTRGLSADFRVQPGRPDLSGRSSLEVCSPAELVALAATEGGCSETEWDGERMTWLGWTGFQLHEKWYASSRLFRVGDCLVEVDLNGAYVEDWRLQASDDGPLIGLRLIEEKQIESGRVTHQSGCLIVCGDHAAFIRGRPSTSNLQGRLNEIVGDGTALGSMVLDAIFSCEASYARRSSQDSFTVLLSTNPLREGQDLLSLDGFSYDPDTELVTQRANEHGVLLERTFTVDTVEPSFRAEPATTVTQNVQDWLRQEADTLLIHAEFPREDHLKEPAFHRSSS